MANVNVVVLTGNLTKDAELRYTPNGKAVTNFTIAVNSGFGDYQETAFVNIVAWGGTAEAIAEHKKKGDEVSVTGRLQTRSYDKDGVTIYVTEVVADEVNFLRNAVREEKTNNPPSNNRGTNTRQSSGSTQNNRQGNRK